jgi:CheY-like chemotaxis protein
MSNSFKRVYLIDDDPTFNFITKLMLKKIAFAEEIVDFTDAGQALDELKEEARKEPACLPELIFLDLNMPGMDGWDFLEAYNELADPALSKVKIFILTSSIDPLDKSKSLTYDGVADFITKPLALEKVKMISKSRSKTLINIHRL